MAVSNKYVFATLPRTQRGQPIVLGGDPKGVNFLYTNGHSVVIRNIDNPAISEVYTEHSCAVNVAKYSPSGFYIASGDQSGKVRIWDTVNKEHLLKNEFHPLGGAVKDIAWSADSQRLVAVGEGRERFGHVFMAETGTSVGEISGQSKPINSVDFRPTRPFRIVTGSEDNTVGVFEGPPFKFARTKQDHSRFVQAVRFSPDGGVFASAGFDGKVFVYDGATAELRGEVGGPAHKGGVYALAWSPDGKKLLTASGDKTCALWDAETRQRVSEFPMGSAVDDQQVSCLWQGKHVLSVSLSGFVNYLDLDNPGKPLRILKGHNKPITVLALSDDKREIFTGSHDGFVTAWDAETGQSERVSGPGHGNQMNGMRTSGTSLYTCGIDDNLRVVDTATRAYAAEGLRLDSQPRGLALRGQLAVTASVGQLTVSEGVRRLAALPVDFEPSCVALSQSEGGDVAVGGAGDNQVHVYSLSGSQLTEKAVLTHLGPITDVAFSNDGSLLAASDSNRKVALYRTSDYQPAHNKEWGFHTARVNCVAFSPDGTRVASGSLDTSIIVWSVLQPSKHTILKNAHPQSQITRVAWLDDATLVSVGQDCNTRLWNVQPF